VKDGTTKKNLTVLLKVVLILGLFVAIFMMLVKTKPEQPALDVQQKSWPVKVVTVSTQTLSPVQSLFGKIESNEFVTAASPVNGVIDTVAVKEGDEVTAGQVLVALSPADIELPYQIAKSDVADTQAQLDLQALAYEADQKKLASEKRVLALKKNDLQRNQQLIKKNLASQSAVEQSKEALVRQEFVVIGAQLSVAENKAKVTQLKARLAKAKANLQQTELNLQRGKVVAPYDARIAKVLVNVGDRVSSSSPMVSFYASNSLELRAKIPAVQLPQVHDALAESVKLQAIYQQESFNHVLPLKRLAGESSTSGLDAFFELPLVLKNTRPGELMQVYLQGKPVDNAIAVPYSALYGYDRIYVVRDGVLQAKAVQSLGETLVDGQTWVLLKGDVQTGDLVTTTHLPNAISGLKVSVVE